MDEIMNHLAEMRLVVEGTIALYERNTAVANDLIGTALYFLRDGLSDCLTACQEAAENGVK